MMMDGPLVGFRLRDGLDGLNRVCAHCDLGNIDIAVGHGDLGERSWT